jgi:uncharacterized membrane protein
MSLEWRSWRGPLLRAGAIFLAGFACLAITPPFQVPDAHDHFARAWQVSRGELRAEKRGDGTGGLVPKALVRDVRGFRDLAFHPDRKIDGSLWRARMAESGPLESDQVFVSFPAIALYSPVPYLPQVAAIAIARVAGLSGLRTLYLAGFFALVACSLVLLAAFRALDHSWRWTTLCFLVAGLPMSFFLIGSISPDGMTIALSLLVFGLALRSGRTEEPRVFAALVIASALLSLCKNAYCAIPIAAIPLALPRGARLRRAATLLAASLLPALVWASLTAGRYSRVRPEAGIDPAGQLRYVLAHPLHVAFVFARAIAVRAHVLLATFVGELGWLDTSLPFAAVIIAALLLIAVGLTASRDAQDEPSRGARAWIAAVVILFCAGMFLLEYMAWMPVGAEDVAGTQGRHFIPITPLGFAALPVCARLKPSALRTLSVAAHTAWLATALIAIVTLVNRYWM